LTTRRVLWLLADEGKKKSKSEVASNYYLDAPFLNILQKLGDSRKGGRGLTPEVAGL
jgi:hypothetical protein